MAYELLRSPMNIGNLTVKNRTVMTAAELSLGQINGEATEMMMDYYEERAKGIQMKHLCMESLKC